METSIAEAWTVETRPEASPSSEASGLRSDAPLLTSRGLTIALIAMCMVPLIVILVLQLTLPAVLPNHLEAEVSLRNVPPTAYYQLPADQRREFPEAEILITNVMSVPWKGINVRINNGHYQVYDHSSPMQPGETRAFLLSEFVHRSGARFQVGIVEPVNVEVYAALPDQSRATLSQPLPR